MMNSSGRSAFNAGDKKPDWNPLLNGLEENVEPAVSSEGGSSTHVRMNDRMARPISGQSPLCLQPTFSNQDFRSPVIAGATCVQAPRFRFASDSLQGNSWRRTLSGSSEPASDCLHSSSYADRAAVLMG